MPKKVIVIGDACVDIHLHLDDIISKREDMPYRSNPGGTSCASAIMLKRLGEDVSFVGTIGDDYGGSYIRNRLEEIGIDTAMMTADGNLNTVNVFSFIDDKGERYLWGFPRENVAYAELKMEEIDIEAIRKADWIHSSGMSLLNGGSILHALPEIYRMAHEAGVATSFDLNTRADDVKLLRPEAVEAIRKVIDHTDYLFGSAKDEIRSFHPCDDYRNSARHLAESCKAVVARLGEEGAFVVADEKEKLVPAYDVSISNTTGAGDGFNAGFIVGMLEGMDAFEASALGNAVAACKISSEAEAYDIDRKMLDDFIKKTPLRI